MMIVNKNTNPERDLYYLGGKIIEIISEPKQNEFDYFELFYELKKKKKISLNLYSLTIDWLFILGVIKKGNKGRIEKCF